jgi:predicted HD phosphohydrolase
MNYKNKVRRKVEHYLQLPKLLQLEASIYGTKIPFRCTKIFIRNSITVAGHPAYSAIRVTGDNTFMLWINPGLDEEMMITAVVHEIGHLIIHKMNEAKGEKKEWWECLACEIMGALAAETLWH